MASSSSYINDDHCFRSQFHQDLFQQYIHKKGVTLEKHFELQEGQYPEILEQIGIRGWRKLSKPRTKISKVLIQEFYANARQDLTPLARGWAEFIIHSIIPTGNKSEIIVERAVLLHSIIKGHDIRVEELIADNIAIIAEAAQGRPKLSFPSTILRLCKEVGVSMAEFRGTEFIPVARPITEQR
ncbi:hypothetical protein PIB30_074044 [Stylosanthes scabra]|uniref:Putative plant transposon protein domain-containing protein n=1 Tax=Stylosanthes scabra TaxID=79078 RepID=A0ABU6UT89_9FABA|nr:hypothetical protein [Stylosanthes scabra]